MSAGFVTGEAVFVELRPARVGSRMVAGGIDLVAQAALLIGLTWLVSRIGGLDAAAAAALTLLVIIGALLGYPVAFETLWRGRTPGKAALGLRVVREDGGPVRFRHALVRGLFGLFLERPPSPLVFVGVLASLANERGRRLGDLAGGTVVIQERVPSRVDAAAVAMPPTLAAWASTLDLTRVSPELALAARSLLVRAPDLRPEAQAALGLQVANALAAAVGPPPAGVYPATFVAAVLAERRRRDELRLVSLAAARPESSAGSVGSWGTPTSPPPGAPSGWAASAPVTGTAAKWGLAPVVPGPPTVGPPPVDPGAPDVGAPPAPLPPTPPPTGPFAPPA